MFNEIRRGIRLWFWQVTRTFFKGLAGIVPLALVAWVLYSLHDVTTVVTQYIVAFIIEKSAMQSFIAEFLAFIILLFGIVLLGAFLSTNVGKFLFGLIEMITRRIPGYTVIKETVEVLLHKRQKTFYTVALGYPLGSAPMIGFITREYETRYAVFYPTSPNPTSGFTQFPRKEEVILCPNITVEVGAKIIFSCAATSESDLCAEHLDARECKDES